MKRYLLALAALLLFSVGFFAAARSAAAWRPQLIGAAPDAYDLQVSPGGRWLLATSSGSDELIYPQQELRLFDTTGQRKPRRFDAAFLKFSPDGQLLVSFEVGRRELQIAEAQSGRVLQRWQGLTPQRFEDVSDVQFQDGGRVLVAVTPFRVWRLDVASGQKLKQTKLQIEYREAAGCGLIVGQTLLRDGRRLLYNNGDEAWIYDARSGARLAKAPSTGELSPDEKTLCWWSPYPGEVWFGDFATGQTLWDGAMNPPQFAGDGKTLVDVDDKTGVRLLDPRSGRLVRPLKVPVPRENANGAGAAFALSPDNDYWFARQNGAIYRYRLR